MTLTCAITEVSPRSGGAASIECWRAIFSTSCYPHTVPTMNRWLVKRFVLHLYIFHLYLIINKNTEKGMYLVIQERFSSNIWYVTIFCEYPVSLKLLLNIPYPNNFFLKYPVSRWFFPQISHIPKTPNGASKYVKSSLTRTKIACPWNCWKKKDTASSKHWINFKATMKFSLLFLVSPVQIPYLSNPLYLIVKTIQHINVHKVSLSALKALCACFFLPPLFLFADIFFKLQKVKLPITWNFFWFPLSVRVTFCMLCPEKIYSLIYYNLFSRLAT